MGNVYSKENVNFKLSLERIIKRRILLEKFLEKQICLQCFQLVKEYESLEEKLYKISENLSCKFQKIHPTKRGRRKKEEIQKVEVEMKEDIKIEVKTENK